MEVRRGSVVWRGVPCSRCCAGEQAGNARCCSYVQLATRTYELRRFRRFAQLKNAGEVGSGIGSVLAQQCHKPPGMAGGGGSQEQAARLTNKQLVPPVISLHIPVMKVYQVVAAGSTIQRLANCA